MDYHNVSAIYMVIGIICMVIEMCRVDKKLSKPETYEERREQSSMYAIYMMMVLMLWPVWLYYILKNIIKNS